MCLFGFTRRSQELICTIKNTFEYTFNSEWRLKSNYFHSLSYRKLNFWYIHVYVSMPKLFWCTVYVCVGSIYYNIFDTLSVWERVNKCSAVLVLVKICLQTQSLLNQSPPCAHVTLPPSCWEKGRVISWSVEHGNITDFFM